MLVSLSYFQANKNQNTCDPKSFLYLFEYAKQSHNEKPLPRGQKLEGQWVQILLSYIDCSAIMHIKFCPLRMSYCTNTSIYTNNVTARSFQELPVHNTKIFRSLLLALQGFDVLITICQITTARSLLTTLFNEIWPRISFV